MRDVQALIPFLHELADAAAAAILPVFRSDPAVENKAADGRYDPVTRADRDAEAAMRRLIAARHPDHGVVGEEFGEDRAGAEHVWVLDPIDGTGAFICGLPLWGVLIGLWIEGKPALGMLAQPFLGERFFGSAEGAFRESGGARSRLQVRACAGLGEAALSTTSPRMFGSDEAPRYLAVEREARLVRYGYDCYAYAMLASGFIDCVIEAGLKAHDIDPLIPIIQGAGGHVADWEGGPAHGGGRVVAAGDARVFQAALERLSVSR